MPPCPLVLLRNALQQRRCIALATQGAQAQSRDLQTFTSAEARTGQNCGFPPCSNAVTFGIQQKKHKRSYNQKKENTERPHALTEGQMGNDRKLQQESKE